MSQNMYNSGYIKQKLSIVRYPEMTISMNVKLGTTFEAREFEENSKTDYLNWEHMELNVHHCVPLHCMNQL